MKKFRFPEDGDVAADLRERWGYDGRLAEIYTSNRGPKVHKWHHYLPLYDQYFSPWCDKPVRFLEIGVNNGGSMQMWRRFFGDDAVIFGIDINPDCAQYDGQAGQVRIGSQEDPDFLSQVVEEMGGLDIVLDDGSHRMKHVKRSLWHLFPKLEEGGLYMVEDMHTAYFEKYGGGLDAEGNFFNTVRDIIDDMHGWYHSGGRKFPPMRRAVGGIHVHDSIVVFEKRARQRPTHSRVS